MDERKILIIEDDASMAAVMREGLESCGLSVSVAHDGAQGVLLAHQVQPDLILLDFRMPGEDGGGVYERLRLSSDTFHTPVVFTTAAPVDEVRARIEPGKMTYFLRKPVSLSRIRAVLERLLDSHLPVPAPDPAPLPETPELPRRELELRVPYADTDKMGVVYYSNYFRYFELGRTELMRSLGVRYSDLEAERKLFLPVAEARCEYLGASHYDDLLVVRTSLERLGPASVSFSYEILRRMDGRLVARGLTRHAVLDRDWHPAHVPPDLQALLELLVRPHGGGPPVPGAGPGSRQSK